MQPEAVPRPKPLGASCGARLATHSRSFASASASVVAGLQSRANGVLRACGRAPGFSLIELMAVLAILAVLAAAAFPVARVAVQRGKEQELRYDLRQLREGIDAYKRAADEGRIAKKLGESGYPKSLDDLVQGVEDSRDPNLNKAKIYFMRRIPRDPMAAPGVGAAESWGKRSYASPPDEPREGDDVFDVYSLNESVGLNGIAYRQW